MPAPAAVVPEVAALTTTPVPRAAQSPAAPTPTPAPNPAPLRAAAPAPASTPVASSQAAAAPQPPPTPLANPAAATAPATVLSTTAESGTVDPVSARRASILDDPTSLVGGPTKRGSLTDRISTYQARVQKAQEAKAEMIQQSQDLFQLIAGDQDLHAVFATDDTFAAVRDEAQANSQNLDDALGLGSDPVKTTEGQTKNLMKFLAAGSLRL